MDYPKSVPNVGLVEGKFVDENPTTGQVGSLIPSAWGNSVTEELLSVIKAAGLKPDESQVNQLLKAIQTFAAADMKKTVRVATTGAIALSGLQSIDGTALVAGDRVLVKNQANAAQNGIYSAAAGGWVRAQDADESIEVSPGMMVPVQAGTTNYGSIWQLSNVTPPTVGTTALTFEQIMGNTGIAPGTYKSLTIDRRGRATAGTNPTTLAGHGITDGMPLGEGGWGAVARTDLPDMKLIGKSRFAYQVPSAGTLNGLSGSAGILLNAEGESAGWQIFIRDEWFYFRGHTRGVWSPDRYVWHSGNFDPTTKADKANTLAGYSITDSYTQVQVNALLATKSPAANPTFTGVVSVPTPARGANNTQAANTAFVAQEVAALIGAAPGALDTLVELAAALGNDPNFATTVTNAIAAKMGPGDFGWGAAAVDFPSNNVNLQWFKSGLYRTSTNAQNIPEGTNPQGSLIRHEVWGDGVVQQTFMEHVTGRTFRRSCNANIWQPWTELLGNMEGAVQAFAMANPPKGWLVCDGGTLSRKAYAALFSKIGTLYGPGDGSTTFNLPDLRAETIRGVDLNRGIDIGRALASLQLDALQRHGHAVTIDAYGVTGGTGEYLGRNSTPGATRQTSRILEPVGLAGEEVRTANETRARNVAMLYCIKY
ncbi:phage tail protein [Pseudomonas sp. WS 5071]|uniref:phage tail protein n=1 Tax=Pseudomonas sp. WS 5071 TaxID=2717479 RepID=UPI001475189F|nr:phage tail protein [Pseudomonas sp. WS 5071]NMY73792.1 hypothetical protein [Pseudomonas sp. WS 5071]